MAIINLLNEQNRRDASENLKSAFKTGVSLAAIGAGGYALNNMGNVNKNVKRALNNSSKGMSDLASAGRVLRSDMETVDQIIKQSKEALVDNFKNKVMTNDKLEEILSSTDIDVNERKALLASLFDSLKGEEMDDELMRSTMIDKVKEAYENGNPLQSKDIDTLKSFYGENISRDQASLGRFRSTYGRYSQVKDLLSTKPLDFGMTPTTQVEFQKINDLSGFSTDQALNQKVKAKYNQIKGMVGSRNISLEMIDEFGKGSSGIKSLYARIDYGEGKINIPLHLQRNGDGMAFYRATSNMSTRYVPPLKVLNGMEVIKGGYGVGNLTNNALMDFEDYIFKEFTKVGRAENLDSRQINSFNAFLRSFGPDAPRAMSGAINQNMGRGFISRGLERNLAGSRLLQASSIFISGVEEMSKEDRGNIVNRLLRSNQEVFSGPSAAQTQVTRIESPFDRKQNRDFLQINLSGENNEFRGYSSFTGVRAFGNRLDRGILPQTARESQMYGRPEFISGMDLDFNSTGKSSLGVTGKGVAAFGFGDELFGVSNRGVGQFTQGTNIAALIVGGKKSSELGLSEGAAYSTTKYKASSNITKTVAQSGLADFELMEVLQKRAAATSGDKFIRIGAFDTDEAAGRFNIDDFFTRFGVGGRSEAILGFGDAGYTSIKRHTGLEEFTLAITEKTKEAGRLRFNISGEATKSLPHMKLFSPLYKGALEQTDIVSLQARLGAMGFGTEFGKFEAGLLEGGRGGIVTDDSMLGKGSQFLGTQIFGGTRYLLGEAGEKELETAFRGKVGDDTAFMDAIRKVQAGATDLESTPVQKRNKAYLQALVESVMGLKSADDQTKGILLGGFHSVVEDGKYGFSLKEAQDLMRGKDSDIYKQASKNVTIGLSHAVSGDMYTDLARNLARIEPRFANYMYQNLTQDFGLSADEATKYMSAYAVRKEGGEGVAKSLEGMRLAQFSLSPGMPGKDLVSQYSKLGNLRFASTDDMQRLFSASSEKEMIEILSESEKGTVVDLDKVPMSKSAREKLKDSMGGKTSFYLPGADTFESMPEYKIRKGLEDIDIEAEYRRYTSDLLGSVKGASLAGEDEAKILQSVRGFETSRELLGRTTAIGMRRVASGQILGSGTYRGRGISLGKQGVGNIGGKLGLNATQKAVFKRVFEKTAGYSVLMDAQAFMDGMTTQKEALRRELMKQTGKADVGKEVNEVMTESLRRFFVGIHSLDPEGVMTDIQRNPVITASNVMLNMEAFRSDIGEADDKFFNILKSEKKVDYIKGNDQTKAAYKKFKEEELEKLNYKDQIKNKKEDIKKKLVASDPKFKADVDELANYKTKETARINSKIKTSLSGFGKKHGMNFSDFESFNKFLGVFLGQEGSDGSVSMLHNKNISYEDRLAARGVYIYNELIKADLDGDRELYDNLTQLQKNIGSTSSFEGRKKLYGMDISHFHNLINVGSLPPAQASGVHGDLLKGIAEAKEEVQKEVEGPRGRVYQAIENNQELKDLRTLLHSQAETTAKRKMIDEDIFNTQGTRVKETRSRLQKLAKIANVQDITSFEQIEKIRSSLPVDKIDEFDRELGKQTNRMIKSHLRSGTQGGGTVSFFDMKVSSSNLVDATGKVVGTFSGRIDPNRAAIGDFDGDIYQVFFRAGQKRLSKEKAPVKFMQAAAETSLMLDELKLGMKSLGKRMGSSDMSLENFIISEKEKERILKGVGGVDIEVKAGFLGLAQSISESTDADAFSKKARAGMTLLGAMQEQIVIQAKKLPMASNVPEEFVRVMRQGYRTGDASQLKKFLTDTILQDTNILKHGEISLRDIEFDNLPKNSEATKFLRKTYGGAKIRLSDIFESLDEMVGMVHKYGYDKLVSDVRLGKAMQSSSIASNKQLMGLLHASNSIEGGILGGSVEAGNALDEIFSSAETLKQNVGRSVMSKMGGVAVGAALVGSYAIGSMMSPSQLESSSNFSDNRARESLSTRNMYHMQKRQSSGVAPSQMAPQDNFYERPIFSGETQVVSNRSTRFYGEAASMSNAVEVGKRFIDAGGTSSMHVQDSRLPISNSYITRSLRD